MHQPFTYMHSLPFGLPSYSGQHRALNRVPCAIQVFSSVIYFVHTINSVYMSIPVSQIPPTHPHPPWYTYVCSINGVAKWCGELVATCLLTNDFGIWPCSSASLNLILTKVKPA